MLAPSALAGAARCVFQKYQPTPGAPRASPAATPAIHVRFFMRAVGPASKPVSRTPYSAEAASDPVSPQFYSVL